MGLVELPRDVWIYKITPHLEISDLLSLRRVNRQLRDLVSSDDVWLNLVIREWFEYDEVKVPRPVSYFNYYTERKRMDKMFLQDLKENRVAEIISQVREYGDLLLPCLLRTRKAERLANLSMNYRASQLIIYLKYCKIYDMLSHVADDKREILNFEQILLTLNMLDPHYYSMIQQRNAVRKQILSNFQSLIYSRQHIDLIKFSRATASVVLLIKTLNKLIKSKEITLKNYIGSDEEFLVFPVYSGFKMSGLAYLSIVCSIAQDLGLQATITREFLIKVRDSNYKEGCSYIFIQNNGRKVEIFNVDKIRQIFRYQRDYGQELQSCDLIKIYFDTALNSKLNESFLSDVRFMFQIFTYLNTKEPELLKDLTATIGSSYSSLHMLKLSKILQIRDKDATKSTISSDFISNFHFFREHTDTTAIKPAFQIGDITWSQRYLEFYLILGYKNQVVAYTNKYHVYYLVMGPDGQFEIVDEDRILTVEDEDLYAELLIKFSRHDKLGIFFERYDHEKKKFVWTKELQNVYNESIQNA